MKLAKKAAAHGELSKQLCDALDGDRESALAMWREVAVRPHDTESLLWAQHVAQRILTVDKVDRRRRPDAILKVVGLAGRGDRYRAQRNLLEVLDAFEDLDARSKWITSGQQSRRDLNALRSHPEFSKLPGARLRKVVASIRARLRARKA